jgi:hypothetical protein
VFGSEAWAHILDEKMKAFDPRGSKIPENSKVLKLNEKVYMTKSSMRSF